MTKEERAREIARKLWDEVLTHSFEPYERIEMALLSFAAEQTEKLKKEMQTLRGHRQVLLATLKVTGRSMAYCGKTANQILAKIHEEMGG